MQAKGLQVKLSQPIPLRTLLTLKCQYCSGAAQWQTGSVKVCSDHVHTPNQNQVQWELAATRAAS
jgi:hypothetical protein